MAPNDPQYQGVTRLHCVVTEDGGHVKFECGFTMAADQVKFVFRDPIRPGDELCFEVRPITHKRKVVETVRLYL